MQINAGQDAYRSNEYLRIRNVSRIDATMSGKSLNKKNLAAIGADALAELVLELVEHDPAGKRRARMELAAHAAPDEFAASVRKRFATIRRADGEISLKAIRPLSNELATHAGLIEEHLAPENPDEAFELLWEMLLLFPRLYERLPMVYPDDFWAVINFVLEIFARLAPRLVRDSAAMADGILDLALSSRHAVHEGATKALGEALGEDGLKHLKERIRALMASPPSEEEMRIYRYWNDAEAKAKALERRESVAKAITDEIADVQGDIDAWLSNREEGELTGLDVAPDAARRLLAAGRAEEALRILDSCIAQNGDQSLDICRARFDCLEALGRDGELDAALQERFERHLCSETLRRRLGRLPDFEDAEMLDRARELVLGFDSAHDALEFSIEWPDLSLAAKLVLSRSEELDGSLQELLSSAAEALEREHPLAATLLWRSMIEFSLDIADRGLHRAAAKYFERCAEADARIDDYGEHPNHVSFDRTLRNEHGFAHGFWSRVG